MDASDQVRRDSGERERVIAGLVDHLRSVIRDHGESTLQFGDVFVRASHHAWDPALQQPDVEDGPVEAALGDALLIQVQGYEALPGPGELWSEEYDPFFTPQQQEALRAQGFHEPEALLPNWWLDAAGDVEVADAAEATVAVLVDVCGVPIGAVAADAPFLEVPDADLPILPRRFEPTTPSGSTVVPDATEVIGEYEAHVLLRRFGQRRHWPEASDIEPAWFVIVDEVSRAQRILEIVALAPIGPGEERVGWYRRTRRGWVADPTLARRLARATGEVLVSVSAETIRDIDAGWVC